VEITSDLYHNESVAYTYVETVSFTADPSCADTGSIDEIYLTLIEDASPYVSWFAAAEDQRLAQITIADEGNTWVCSEVVDVTIYGSLYANALDALCQQQAAAFNSNIVFTPIIVR
jgi:hypothetical protein